MEIEVGDEVDFMCSGNRYTVLGSVFYNGVKFHVGVNRHGQEKDLGPLLTQKVENENQDPVSRR